MCIRDRGKVALVIVLVLVLIAAVAYLLTQEYVVYDDEGKACLLYTSRCV